MDSLPWEIWAAIVTVVIFLLAVLKWFFSDGFRALIRWSLRSDKVATRGLINEALRDDPAVTRAIFGEIFAERFSAVDEAVELTHINSDRLDAMESAILAQGESISKSMNETFKNLGHTMRGVNESLGKMNEQLVTQGRELSRLSGVMEAWDGNERRRGSGRVD